MKRLLGIATALLVAALFALPTAAIASLDGTEPVFDGDAGIVPLTESIEIIDEPVYEPIMPIDANPLARSESTPVQVYAALALAAYMGLGTLSLAALSLSIIALVKIKRMKATEEPTDA